MEEVDWLLRIHDVYQRAEAKQSEGAGPKLPDVPMIS